MFLTRTHTLLVDAAAVRENLSAVRRLVGDRRLWAVVKDDAYGHGMLPVATALAAGGVRRFAVGDVESAVGLLDAGLGEEVLNLRLFAPDEADEIVGRGIVQAVASGDQLMALAAAASRLGRPARVQVKVDTGMGRFGFPVEKVADTIRAFRGDADFDLRGVFTALAEDPPFDDGQVARLRAVREEIGAVPGEPWHAVGSAGLLTRPGDLLDGARVGALLCGFSPFVRRPAPGGAEARVRPCVRLEARVIRRVDYAEGDHAGFGPGLGRACRAIWIDAGARHGLAYPEGAEVLLGGRRHRVLRSGGEYTILSLGTGTEAAPGDRAVLIGEDGRDRIGLAEWAAFFGESPYTALLRNLNRRVRRVLAG